MRDKTKLPRDLGITRLLWVFAGLSVALLVALAAAPAKSTFTEWKDAQEAYNRIARGAGISEVPLGVKQIWKAELGVVDRCTSCHIGMGVAEPIAGERLFRAHPAIPHDPSEFGCTVCHAGQGRATTKEDAHGNVRHWDEPLLEPGTYEAGCGACHTHIRVPSGTAAARGRALVERYACRDCHRVNGVGRGDGPDLSHAGVRGFRADWHQRHLDARARATEGPWRASFAELREGELSAVNEYLGTLIGAPRLMEAKALAHRLGCRGCHRIGGVGGDDGPDLSDEGRKLAADLDFAGVAGAHTLRNWLTDHFLDPAGVVRASTMPDLGLSREDAELLTVYMLSLRKRAIPEALVPGDRIRGVKFGEREFATDGEALYGVFCAACHGPRGEGRRFGTSDAAFPAIGNAEFLALADDAFLRKTLVDGRPGRRMPAWGTKDGGLTADEIDAVVKFLRTLEKPPPAHDEVMKARPDLGAGRAGFARECAPCHGRAGEGSAIAPPLAAADNPITKTEGAVYATMSYGIATAAMRPFRTFDAQSMRNVIAAVVALPRLIGVRRDGWAPAKGDSARGEAAYARACSGCHGPRGQGGDAPGIGRPAFLAAADDGYLKATIVRGRPGTTMPAFGQPSLQHAQLDAGEVADLVAYLRSLGAPVLAQGGSQ
jgi:mono/diheme cytochrome c family protein